MFSKKRKSAKINNSASKVLNKSLVVQNQEKPPKRRFFSNWFARRKTFLDKTSTTHINFGWTRKPTKNIIKQLLKQGCDHFYFYTDSSNIFIILEQGIKTTNSKELKKGTQYVVWTYLEKPDHIELELANSSRHQFWNWCLENNIDLSRIAIFYIDLVKLFNHTKKDWGFDNELQRVIINETIPLLTIEGILVKDMAIYTRIQQYLQHQKIDVKIFFGDKDLIEELKTKG